MGLTPPLFTSQAVDSGDTTLLGPLAWNRVTDLLNSLLNAADADGSLAWRDTSDVTDGVSWLAPSAGVLVSSGTGPPAFTQTPILTGNLTLGVQSTGGVKLRVAHAQPAAGLPNAYFGIFPATFTWTNNGTYYDNTCFYGWNGDIADLTEPQFGLSLESKFSQGSGQPFLVEMHHVASFADGKSVRVLSHSVDRAAPHLGVSVLAGQIDVWTSATSAAQALNFRIAENGSTNWYNGPPIVIANYAQGASTTGKGELAILSSDAFPQFVWRLSGAQKVALSAQLTDGSLKLQVAAGGYYWVNGGHIYVEGGTQTAANPILDVRQTWNASGTVFPGIRFQATNQASAAASTLIDLQVGGVSQFSVRKDGLVTHASATMLATSVALTNGAASQTGTLTNAPAAGNPTKWIPINDNGVTRYIPAW